MLTRIYLACAGLIYLYLAIWCSLDPVATSKAVGFERVGASGNSEFLTVYGGLEFGLALVLLLPLIDRHATYYSLTACTLIHGSLVVFRTMGFFLYDAPAAMTYQLAAGEWVIFLVSLVLWLANRRQSNSDPEVH